MSTKYEKGTVAKITVSVVVDPTVLAFRDSDHSWRDAGGYTWWDTDEIWKREGSGDDGTGRGYVREVRPLVVIDSEDMAEVERFREIASRWADRVPYADSREPGDLTHGDAMQAALREFAAPRPEEPKGLGAVVESFEGSVWVRGHHNNRSSWVRAGFDENRSWDEVPTPLTVLHPGYTPEAK